MSASRPNWSPVFEGLDSSLGIIKARIQLLEIRVSLFGQAVSHYELAVENVCQCKEGSDSDCSYCEHLIAARNLLRYSSPEAPEQQGN